MKKRRQSLYIKTAALVLLFICVFGTLVWNALESSPIATAVLTLVTLLLVAAIAGLEMRNTEQARAEERRMRENNERLHLAMRSMTATIWDYDLKRHEIIQNEDSQEKHGFETVVPNVPEGLIACGFVHPESAEAFREMYAKLFAGEPRAEGVFRVRTADGTDWWYEHIQYVNLFDENGKPYRAVGMSQDVTDRQMLETAARTDSLTCLLNHSATVERIKALLTELDPADTSALFIVDLDYFKQINDELGHQMGDKMLVKVSGIIRESFRSEDVVGRIGGDEFMVFLCRTPNLGMIRKKACQLVEALQLYTGDGAKGVSLSASIGIAIRRAGDDFAALYKRADEALYRAKEKGRNTYELDTEMTGNAAPLAARPQHAESHPQDGGLSPVQLQALMEHLDGGVLLFEVGETFRAHYVSPSFYKFTGIPPTATAQGLKLLNMVRKGDREVLIEKLRRGAQEDTSVDFSFLVNTYGGGQSWRHIRAVRIHSDEREAPLMLAVITDISEIKKTSAMLDAIVENSPLGIGIFDASEGFKPVYVNPVLLKMFNFSKETFFTNAGENALNMVDEQDRPKAREVISRIIKLGGVGELVYRTAKRSDMPRRSIRANGLRIPGTANESLFLIMFNDITNQLSAMTPAPNRVQALTPSGKRQVLIVDDNEINRVVLRKIISGEYEVLEAKNGRDALDRLSYISERVSAVLLDLAMPEMDGFEVLRRMRGDANLSKIPVIVTTGNAESLAEVKALSLGANDYIVKPYNPAVIRHRLANTINLRETAAFVNAVERDALTGLYSKEFFYQRAENAIHAAGPGRFDLICGDIERFKLINELFGNRTGDRLLKHVADLLAENMKEGCLFGRIGADKFACLVPHREAYTETVFAAFLRQVNRFPLSMNISMRFGVCVVEDLSLPVSTVCDRALTACNSVKGRYGMNFAYYDDSFRQKLLAEQLICAVKALKDRGFIIEMDDFGSGYSSLNMLSELPIDILKLDMRFMNGGADSARKEGVLEAVLRLAKRLCLPVVAEGVETAGQAHILRSLGCEYAQGFHFARPMPRVEFERFLQTARLESDMSEVQEKEARKLELQKKEGDPS